MPFFACASDCSTFQVAPCYSVSSGRPSGAKSERVPGDADILPLKLDIVWFTALATLGSVSGGFPDTDMFRAFLRIAPTPSAASARPRLMIAAATAATAAVAATASAHSQGVTLDLEPTVVSTLRSSVQTALDAASTGGLSAQQYIDALGLIAHPEGGFFRETFRSGSEPMSSKGKTDDDGDLMASPQRIGGQRNVLTSIFYMITTDSDRQWWANNMSDHIHYWHGGGSLTYHLVHPDGSYECKVLGPRADKGEVLQLIVRGGSFKCAHLEKGAGDFVLLGEGVAPGFDFRDFAFVSASELKALLPADKYKKLAAFLKERPESEFDDYYDKPTTRA